MADDIKYSEHAGDRWGDGPHEVDIGGDLAEPTEVQIGPADADADTDVTLSPPESPPSAADGDPLDDLD